MDYRNILATGFLLLCGAVFVQSLKSANAFPQGPNVSMGSNPIESWSGQIGSDGWYTLDTFQDDFIITDFSISGQSYCNFQLHNSQSSTANSAIASGYFYQSSGQGQSSYSHRFASGMKIPAGTTVYMYVNRHSSYCHYNISGYYTH